MKKVGAWPVVLAVGLAAAGPAAGVAHGQGAHLDVFDLVPFVGFPLNSDVGGAQQAAGVHVIWPGTGPTALAARYEIRWASEGRRYDAASLDLVRRVAGSDTASIALTGGWARWDRRDHATLGVRAAFPFIPPDEGGAVFIQGWIDLRYAVSGTRALRDGVLWTQLMLGVVVRNQWRGRR